MDLFGGKQWHELEFDLSQEATVGLSKPFSGHFSNLLDNSILSVLRLIKYSVPPRDLDPTVTPLLGGRRVLWGVSHFYACFPQHG